jgi:CRISPR/Cas system-associated endoribonuclease Cas2
MSLEKKVALYEKIFHALVLWYPRSFFPSSVDSDGFFKELKLKLETILHDSESVRVSLLKNCSFTKRQALVLTTLFDISFCEQSRTGD